MEISLLLTYLVIVTSIAFSYYIWIFGYWKRRNVQTLTPNFLLGNLGPTLFGKVGLTDIFKETYKKFKPAGCRYAGYYYLMKPIWVVFDPKLIETILVKDFKHFTDRPMYTNKEVDPMSNHLFSMKGSEWRNLRNTLSPAFTKNKLKMMLEYFLIIGNNLKIAVDDICKNSQVVDIRDITGKYIVDIITTSFIGIESNSLLKEENYFNTFIEKWLHGDIYNRIRFFIAFFIPSVFNILRIPVIGKESHKFYANLTKQIVEYRENNSIAKKDFMQLLIQIRNHIDIENNDTGIVSEVKHEKLLSIEDIASQLGLFFSAGADSSSSAVSICLYYLVQNPEAYEKLTNEVNRVLSNHKGEISYDSLRDMSYMDMCLKETTRLYPALPYLSRECTTDWVVPGTDLLIEKGTNVQIPLLEIHHDPEYYPNPEQFNPDRFSPENKPKLTPFTHLPFGDGPHMCIGMRIANVMVKVALTILLKNYRFRLNPKTNVPLQKESIDIFIKILGGIWLDIEKIEEQTQDAEH